MVSFQFAHLFFSQVEWNGYITREHVEISLYALFFYETEDEKKESQIREK